MLIELTDKNSNHILVNFDRIQTVKPMSSGGTLIGFSSRPGDFVEVQESLDDLLEIDQAQ